MLIDGRAVYRRRYLRDGYEEEIDEKAGRCARGAHLGGGSVIGRPRNGSDCWSYTAAVV
jgi:hypothetical protein